MHMPKDLANNNFPIFNQPVFPLLTFVPFSRAEHRSLPGGSAERGIAWMRCVGRGTRMSILPTPLGMREAQGLSRLPGGLFFGYVCVKR